MSSPVALDSETVLKAISKMEKELNALRLAAGVAPVAAPKTRKPRDPDAPKKEPNEWIKFTQRVDAALKGAEIKIPAVDSKQFASHLKGLKAYAEWDDAEIVSSFGGWTKPEVSKQEAEGKSKRKESVASAEEAASVAEVPVADAKKPRKPRGPMSDEAKAAMAEKRKATLAAKKAAETPASAPATPVKAASAPAAAPGAPKKAPKTAAKAAAPPAAPVKLDDFELWEHEGEQYLKNSRGDLLTEDGDWVGRFDGKAIVEIEQPADLEKIIEALLA